MAPGDSQDRSAWVGLWRRVDAAASRSTPSSSTTPGEGGEPEAEAGEGGPGLRGLEGTIVDRLVRRVPEDDLLFVSSSMPVRDLDTFGLHRPLPLTVLGNRGASGIDGIPSTAAGASFGSGRRVVAVLGDLAFLHDAGGLLGLGAAGERVLLVVIHNDGGGIFHLLPIREYEPAFTPFFATPHGRGMEGLAHFHGLEFRSLEFRSGVARSGGGGAPVPELDEALQWLLGRPGSGILEIRTDREENRRLRGEILTAAGRNALKAVESGNAGRGLPGPDEG
ncbi:MAG: hypothetical protein EA422_11245 [Gemmatimonadales bacterium]|nr:MAG: hypothetical protein EA422_11245 [Gemmatimonadales bacterium]